MLLLTGLGLALLILASVLLPAFVGGAWSPTPMYVVRAMLERADVKPQHMVYDLGAGDGRTVIQAAKMGAHCYAVEVDPLKTWVIKLRILQPKLASRIQILHENFFCTDLRQADVVTAYLSPAAIEKLATKFTAELKPGAKVVSYRRPIPGWKADSSANEIYVYTMPQNQVKVQSRDKTVVLA